MEILFIAIVILIGMLIELPDTVQKWRAKLKEDGEWRKVVLWVVIWMVIPAAIFLFVWKVL